MTFEFIPLTLEDCDITVEALPEDIPVRGNALASGDDEIDKREEDRIIEDLEWNEWAWCTAKVTVKYEEFEAYEYLGCCSYESEGDFIENSGYYEDMTRSALALLNERLEEFERKEYERIQSTVPSGARAE